MVAKLNVTCCDSEPGATIYQLLQALRHGKRQELCDFSIELHIINRIEIVLYKEYDQHVGDRLHVIGEVDQLEHDTICNRQTWSIKKRSAMASSWTSMVLGWVVSFSPHRMIKNQMKKNLSTFERQIYCICTNCKGIGDKGKNAMLGGKRSELSTRPKQPFQKQIVLNLCNAHTQSKFKPRSCRLGGAALLLPVRWTSYPSAPSADWYMRASWGQSSIPLPCVLGRAGSA